MVSAHSDKPNPRVLLAYCFYALGNKATTSIIFTISPVMLTAAAKAQQAGAQPQLRPTTVSGLVFAASLLLQCVGALLLGELADLHGCRLRLLALHVALGVGCNLALGLLADGASLLAVALLQIALFYAMGVASTMYNAILPLAAARPHRATLSLLSALASAAGGVAFLSAQHATLAGSPPAPAELRRVCLLAAGAWLAAALPSLSYLGGARLERAGERGARAVACGVPCPSLAGARRLVRQQPHAARFVAAQALYLTGAMADASLASLFASEVMEVDVRGLTLLAISAAAAAAAGAACTLLLVRVARLREASVLCALMCASPLLVLYLALFLAEKEEFAALAVARGFIAGGVGFQGLNRGVFATMVPRGHEAELFALWTVAIKALSWLGPLADAALNQLSGSLRVAVLGSLLFYAPALALMGGTDLDAARREADEAAALVPVVDDLALAAAVRAEWLGAAAAEAELGVPPPYHPNGARYDPHPGGRVHATGTHTRNE